MASIQMIPEEEATGKVKAIYEEIMSELGIDFVPNLYKMMAAALSSLILDMYVKRPVRKEC